MIQLHTNPFDNLDVVAVEAQGLTLQQAFEMHCNADLPTICLVNGEPVMRADWHKNIDDDDVVQFMVVPQDPISAIVWFVAENYAISVATATFLEVALTVAAVLLVSQLLKPPKPQTLADIEQSSTYSINSQGNQARLGQTIPVLYGRHIVYPDFAAQPYYEFENDEQYLFQTFCVGLGEYEIENVRIEDTPVENFSEIEWYQVAPGTSFTQWRPNAVSAIEVGGQEMIGTNEEGYDWIGGFITNPAGTQVDTLSVDIICDQGLFKHGSSIQNATISFEFLYRAVNDDGNPIGTWTELTRQELTLNQTVPVRRTYKLSVPLGRYEVKGRRTNAQDDDTAVMDKVSWGGLRGYMVQDSYPDVTTIMMKMRATNNLSQEASRKVNVIATRKLPAYDGTWHDDTLIATRNPAKAFADIIRNPIYGVGVEDAFNVTDFTDFHYVCEGREDWFDGIFDNKITIWEALTSVCRVGRAAPVQQANVTRLIRDQDTVVYAGVFTPSNMVKGSFSLGYKVPTADTADGVTVKFLDEKTWSMNTISLDADRNTPSNPAEIEIFGITQYSQAYMECEYMAKSNRYRRRTVSFKTELDGLILLYGDMIKVVHDSPNWGEFAKVVSYNAGTLTLSLDRPVSSDMTVVNIRGGDGALSDTVDISFIVNGQNVTLTEAPADLPEAGWIVALGKTDKLVMDCRVTSVRPNESDVEITALVETMDDNGNNIMLYEGRHGLIAPDGTADYPSGDQQYGYISLDTDLMPNGDEPYTFGIQT